jgi:hypothetical protein
MPDIRRIADNCVEESIKIPWLNSEEVGFAEIPSGNTEASQLCRKELSPCIDIYTID